MEVLVYILAPLLLVVTSLYSIMMRTKLLDYQARLKEINEDYQTIIKKWNDSTKMWSNLHTELRTASKDYADLYGKKVPPKERAEKYEALLKILKK